MEFVNGKDDIPYIMENKSHVWNHQPDIYIYIYYPIIYFPFLIGKSTISMAMKWKITAMFETTNQ